MRQHQTKLKRPHKEIELTMARPIDVVRAIFFGVMLIAAVLALAACGTSTPQAPSTQHPEPTNTTQPVDDHTAANPDSSADTTTVTVERVIDGDTVAVTPTNDLAATNETGTEHSVRLLGIDAPEMDWEHHQHECGAEAATQAVEAMIAPGDTITLVYDQDADQTDRYGRSLAYVETAEGTDVALDLVSQGLVAAWYPTSAPEPSRYADYQAAQHRAEDASQGSWATCDTMGR